MCLLNAFMSCYLFFMSWTPCFFRRPRVSVCCSCTHVTCYSFVVFRTLCFWRRPRACVLPSLPLVRTLCVVGACTQALVPYLRALCYCFGACKQAGPLVVSLCSRCVAVSRGVYPMLSCCFASLVGVGARTSPYSYCMHFAKCFGARIVPLSHLGGFFVLQKREVGV